MICLNIRPDERTFPFALTAAARARHVHKGQELHASALKLGFLSHVFVGNTLLSFYGSCGFVSSAEKVFDQMPQKDVVSWNSAVSVFSDSGLFSESLSWFLRLRRSGFEVNSVSLLSVIPASVNEREEKFGIGIHGLGIRTGLINVLTVGNSLVNMYGSFGHINASMRMFSSLPERNEVSWNSIIGCLVQVGLHEDALKMLRTMLNQGLCPSSITITSSVPALVELGRFDLAREIHGYCLRREMHSDVYVANSLIDMYAKSSCSEKARYIFEMIDSPNIVSWNAMIYNCAQNKLEMDALALLREMVRKGEVPNPVTFVNLLPACARIASSKKGKELHALSVRNGSIFDLFVSNAFIDMYVKCGRIDLARKVFNSSERDEISYNTMIMGYAQSQFCIEALNLFIEMREIGINYDMISFMGASSACANLSAFKKGKEIHCQVIRKLLSNHLFVANSLLDLYTKAGNFEIANRVFQRISKRDVSSWNSFILGYGQHGEVDSVFRLFDGMPLDGVAYDQVSYIAVLSACGHGGLVNKGKFYFSQMLRDKNVKPKNSHYACMVDLLGRAGLLTEAEELIKGMPFEPNSDVWGALLGSCRLYGDIEMACRASMHLFKLKPDNSGYYAVLSNMYAEVGRWDEADEIRRLMKDRKVKKNPGYSWVRSGNRVGTFVSGELINLPEAGIVC
jgi:pentatricopeptide repeat protein